MVIDTESAGNAGADPPIGGSAPKADVDVSTYTFTPMVVNITKSPGHDLRGEEHEFGDFRWRLLVYPQGNSNKNALSVYLECAGPAQVSPDQDSPASWSKVMSFKLVLYSKGASPDIVKESRYEFTHRETDWGFSEFAFFEKLLSPDETYLGDDGEVKLGAILSTKYVEEYDSKLVTGFNGFKNQVLYTVGKFRKAVYGMKVPGDSISNSVSYALQKVFYELQNGSSVVKTKKLTKSFGWDTADAFTQHDVQELNRILCSHLEETMRKSGDNTMSELFEGKLLNYIECVHVPDKSTREETFFDLSLTIKGCANIYESFDKYTEVEMLEGDNKYRADGYEELQEARKGVKFLRLPPVLQLHLKRFEYDYMRDINVKINDRFEFPLELDLSKYVEGGVEEVYNLHAVLVHVGDVHAGHYYVYIRPDIQENKWYKFDDEIVTIVDESDAVEDNFGNAMIRRYSNAYMLQYIRRSVVDDILPKVKAEDVSQALHERIQQEALAEDRRRRELAEQYLYLDVVIIREADMATPSGIDLVSWDMVEKRHEKKSTTLVELRATLEESILSNTVHHLRLWNMSQRRNSTIRTDRLLNKESDDFKELGMLAKGDAELQIFVEELAAGDKVALERGDIIEFFKVYTPRPVPSLRYVGHLTCSSEVCLRNVVPLLYQLKALTSEERELIKQGKVSFFEEVTPEHVKRVQLEVPFPNCDMEEGGDIIVIQLQGSVDSEGNGEDHAASAPLNGRRRALLDRSETLNAPQYYFYALKRIEVEFRDIQQPTEPGLVLELLKTDTYETTRSRLAQALGSDVNPNRLRLYPFSASSHSTLPDHFTMSSLQSRGDSLETMLLASSNGADAYAQQGPELRILSYERTAYDIDAFESDMNDEVWVTWRYDGGASVPGVSAALVTTSSAPWKRTQCISLLVPAITGTYARVVEELRRQLEIPDDVSIRLLDIKSSFICRQIPLNETVALHSQRRANLLKSDAELRAEPDLSIDEEELGSDYEMVSVMHIPTGGNRLKPVYFGDPFLLPVRASGEQVGRLRERVRRCIRVPVDKYESFFRLAELSFNDVQFLSDDDAVWQLKPTSDELDGYRALAIEHVRKVPPKRTYGLMMYDKPLTIRA